MFFVSFNSLFAAHMCLTSTQQHPTYNKTSGCRSACLCVWFTENSDSKSNIKMTKYFVSVQPSILLTYCLYLLLASSIVTKSINCFVLENSEWSTVIADTNRDEMPDNTTITTTEKSNDDSNGYTSTNFQLKASDNDEYSTLANDDTSMGDIETGKYWLISSYSSSTTPSSNWYFLVILESRRINRSGVDYWDTTDTQGEKKHNLNMIDQRNFGGIFRSLTDSRRQTGSNSMTAARWGCMEWHAITISRL